MLTLKILTEPAPAVTATRQDVPEALDAVVQKALAKEPEQRFADMKSFAQALEPFAAHAEEVKVSLATEAFAKTETPMQAEVQASDRASLSSQTPKLPLIATGVALLGGLTWFALQSGTALPTHAHPSHGDAPKSPVPPAPASSNSTADPCWV